MEYECFETLNYWRQLPKLFLSECFFSLRKVMASDQSKTQSAETEIFMCFFPDAESRFLEVLAIPSSYENEEHVLKRRNLLCSHIDKLEWHISKARFNLRKEKAGKCLHFKLHFLNLNPWTTADVGNIFPLMCHCASCCTMLLNKSQSSVYIAELVQAMPNLRPQEAPG